LKVKGWLGGLDSNQDNQIQSLMYYQLYDLPTGRKTTAGAAGTTQLTLLANWIFVNQERQVEMGTGRRSRT
jgi:hypothetical protein